MLHHRLVLSAAVAVLLRAGCAEAGGAAMPSLGPTTTQQAVNQINRSVTRPLPSLAAPTVPQPNTTWVPEHFTLGDVRVPGHWEHHLPDGSTYVPPLVIDDPRTGERLVPGHVVTSPFAPQAP